MIVRRLEGSWSLIRQVDHAQHAGLITDAWKRGEFGGEQITDSLRVATAQHDVGWTRADAEPEIDPSNGAPSNFTQIDEARHTAFYARAVRTIAEADAAAAYLVSLHASGLYSRRYGWWGLNPVDWVSIGGHGRALLAQERDYRAQLAARMPPAAAEFEAVWRSYMLLETFDFLSLLTCFGLDSEGCGPVPSVAGQWLTLTVRRLGPWEVGLDPFPFPDGELVVPVSAWRLPGTSFSSAEELRRVLAGSEQVVEQTVYRPL